jgi:hypothetical protein
MAGPPETALPRLMAQMEELDLAVRLHGLHVPEVNDVTFRRQIVTGNRYEEMSPYNLEPFVLGIEWASLAVVITAAVLSLQDRRKSN